MAIIELGTLYFSANFQLTTPHYIVCKNQNFANLSAHATLSVVSALRCKNGFVINIRAVICLL